MYSNEDDDDCLNFIESLDTQLDIFQGFYNKHMKLSAEDFEEDEIEEIQKLEEQINFVGTNVKKKFDSIESKMRDCKNHRKSKQKNDISIKRKKFEEVYSKYLQRVEKNKEKIEEEDIKKEENHFNKIQNNSQKENNLNYGENNLNEEEDGGIEFNEKNLKIVQTVMEDDNNFLNCSEEELKQIVDLKNQLKELMSAINQKVDQADYQLEDIESNVNHAQIQVKKGNAELKKAAYNHVSGHTVKYSLVFGGILGALGTIVPGIGNVIGAAVGVGIGTGLAKLEKKALDRIDKKHKKK